MIRATGTKPGVRAAAGAAPAKGAKATGWLVAGVVLGQVAALAAGFGGAKAVEGLQGSLNLPIAGEQSTGLAAAGMLLVGTLLGPQVFAGLAAYRRWKPAVTLVASILAGGLIAWSWAISNFGQSFEGVFAGTGIHAAWIAAGVIGAGLVTARRRIEA